MTSPPNPKRQKLGGEEVGIVLDDEGMYSVYIIDLNKKEEEEEGSVLLPAIQIDGSHPFRMAFAIVNSTLYMFGGLVFVGPYLPLKSVVESRCIDLSPYRDSREPSIVKFENFNTISPMDTPKADPRAVVIQGKICVFSSLLGDGGSNFEMYDPKTNKWSSVPEPPIKACEIHFYFVENHSFYVCTEKGSCCIDFSRPRECLEWMPYDVPPSFETFVPGLKDGDFLVSSCFQVHHANNPNLGFAFSPWRDRVLDFPDLAIVRLPEKDKERLRACIVQVGLFECCDYEDPFRDQYMRLSFFKFDHQLTPTILNSPTFNLGIVGETSGFRIAGIFPYRSDQTMLEYSR